MDYDSPTSRSPDRLLQEALDAHDFIAALFDGGVDA